MPSFHIFDKEGAHLQTRHWFAGTTAQGEPSVTREGFRHLAKMIMELGSFRFCDIAVKRFQTTIDGHVFGLIERSDADGGMETVHLLPNDLVFYHPWDGTYDT
jgi:formate hydrogenlyase regulatory protein HycA